MFDWLYAGSTYTVLVIIHVFAVVAWMAGMLYLPRLFVYHSKVAPGSEASELFKVMEHKLLKIIINPAMIVTWIAGLLLATNAGYWAQGWLHGKILLVLLMSGAHGYFSANRRRFAADQRPKTEKHWRLMNEVPALFLIGILVLVYWKPF